MRRQDEQRGTLTWDGLKQHWTGDKQHRRATHPLCYQRAADRGSVHERIRNTRERWQAAAIHPSEQVGWAPE
jgi:hypothetical protein